MTPAGIVPATFRFVAQNLNHCAIAVAHFVQCRSANYELLLDLVMSNVIDMYWRAGRCRCLIRWYLHHHQNYQHQHHAFKDLCLLAHSGLNITSLKYFFFLKLDILRSFFLCWLLLHNNLHDFQSVHNTNMLDLFIVITVALSTKLVVFSVLNSCKISSFLSFIIADNGARRGKVITDL